MGRQTYCLRVATQFQKLYILQSVSLIRRYAGHFCRKYPLPITQEMRRWLMNADRIVRHASHKSILQSSVHTRITPSPALCGAVLPDTYLCSLNLILVYPSPTDLSSSSFKFQRFAQFRRINFVQYFNLSQENL